MEIKGKKIILNTVKFCDLDFICEIELNKSLWKYEEYVEKDMETIKNLYIDRIKKKVNAYDFVVNEIFTNNKVGIGDIREYNGFENSWEIGYAVLPQYQNRGFGGETAKLLIGYGFKYLNAKKIVAICNTENAKSQLVLENAGMIRESVFKNALFCNEKWTDLYLFSIKK